MRAYLLQSALRELVAFIVSADMPLDMKTEALKLTYNADCVGDVLSTILRIKSW
jgi:hypothetical protein